MHRLILSLIIIFQLAAADNRQVIELTKPAKKIGIDLLQALYQRKSTNEYADKQISQDTLGALLWAANGINREDGKRTAPAAFNSQFINIYVAADEAVYLYDGKEHALNLVTSANLKDKVGIQEFVKTAPIVLIITAALNKLPVYAGSRSSRIAAAYATSGCIAQNIYLICTALNLGTRYVMFINDKGIKHYLKLNKNEIPLCVMPVGYLK